MECRQKGRDMEKQFCRNVALPEFEASEKLG